MRSNTRGQLPYRALLGAAVVLAVGGVAHAGLKTPYPVVVSAAGHYAYGSTGTARNTGTNQYIECQTSAATETGMISCVASDNSGNTAACSATDPIAYGDELGSLPLMAEGAYLEFTWDDAGLCTSITIGVTSANEPKLP